MPELTTTEKAGYGSHVAAAGNPHGTKLSELGAPDAVVDFNNQGLLNVGVSTGAVTTTTLEALAPNFGEVQVEVPGDGTSHHQFNIALTNDFFYRVEVDVVGINQTDQSEMYRHMVILASCKTGAAKIIGLQPLDDTIAADAGSIFDGATVYGAPSVSGANLRITLNAHATDAVHYHINVKLSATEFPEA